MKYSLKNEVHANKFEEIVNQVVNSKKIYRKRVKIYKIDGNCKSVEGEVISSSELTSWDFSIYFDGYDDNLTRSVYSDNDMSQIPYTLADDIIYELRYIMLEKMLIEIKYSVNQLTQMSAYDAKEELLKLGFTNINYQVIKDVKYNSIYEYGRVEQIVINGKNTFDAEDCFYYNDKITIMYHDYKDISVYSEKFDKKHETKEMICNRLRNLGFINIYYVAEKELIKGWVNKPNHVKYIQIGDDKPFKEGRKYKSDEKVRIGYYAFKD